VVAAGLAASFAAANTDGSKFASPSVERTFLRVKNTNGSARNVTLVAQNTSAQVPGAGLQAIASIVVNIPATTGDKVIGPIPPAYVDTSGFAHVTFDAVSGLTIGAFHLARRG
jgi:hypothetical protein